MATASDSSSVFRTADATVKEVLADLGVHRRQRVVKEVNVGVVVDGTGKGHPVLLAAAQVDALLANLGLKFRPRG